MDLTFQKLRYKRLAENFSTQEETAEITIPDALPDATRIVDCRTVVLLRDRTFHEGQVRAVVRATVLYIPEDSRNTPERPVVLETPITFHHSCELYDAPDNCDLHCTAEVINADARLINSRKLHIRVEVGFRVSVWRDTEESIADGMESMENTEILCRNVEMQLAAVTGSKNFTVIEEIPLDNVNPDEILAINAVIFPDKCNVSAGRAELCANVSADILYCDSEGLTRSHTAVFSFTQSADFPGIDESMTADIRYSLRTLDTEHTGTPESPGTLTLTLGVTADAVFHECVPVSLLTDAYCMDAELMLQTSDYAYQAPGRTVGEAVEYSDTIETACDVSRLISCGLTAPETQGPDVRIILRAFWQSSDGTLNSICRRIPVTLPAIASGTVHPEISETEIRPAENGLAVKFKICGICASGTENHIAVITSAEKGAEIERRRDISLTLCYAQSVNLWELGRRYHTPIAAIRALNHLPVTADGEAPDETFPLPDGVFLIPYVNVQ